VMVCVRCTGDDGARCSVRYRAWDVVRVVRVVSCAWCRARGVVRVVSCAWCRARGIVRVVSCAWVVLCVYDGVIAVAHDVMRDVVRDDT